MGCLDRIKLYNNQLTKTDMKIVAYFKKHIETIPYLSVEELANKVDVSPAAVIRFIKRLQYNSFAECKIDVAKSDINRALNIENLKFNTSDSIHSLTKKIGAMTTDLFSQTIDMINYKKLEDTVARLRKAGKIILFGMGSSGLVAIDLQYKLLRIQKNCLFNSDGHVQMINANFAEENDVVIAFSYRGETKEVIKAVQTARKKGAYIVGVTSNTASPLYKICDACHLIPQSEGEIRLGAIQSRYAQLLICDILYIAIAQENFDAVKKMIVDTRMMLY